MKLFDEDEQEEIETFKINESYAKRFEYNKKRQELEQLKEKYKDVPLSGSETESSTSEEEDEVGELITPEIDAKIMQTLQLIKKKDEKVYDPNVKFFPEKEADDEEEEEVEGKKKAKPIYLSDYQRKKLLETGGKEIASDDDEDPPVDESFASEQQKLRKEFKDAVQALSEDEEELFEKKEVTEDERNQYSKYILSKMYEDDPKKQSWDKIKNTLEDDQKFLLDYVLHKGWVQDSAEPTFTQHELHDTTDEEEEEDVDEYEMQHNFRFEESGADKLVTHARNIPGAIRRKDNRRILQRQAHEERKALEKEKKQQELRRLKNLKKQELAEKLKQIQEMAGGDLVGLDEIDLTKEFDPNEHDAKMQKIFTEEYFQKVCVGLIQKEDLKKPVFDDDIDITDLIDEPESKVIDYSKKVAPPPASHPEMEKYMEEYYQLDFEDIIGDQPVRFKYRKVDPNSFNLSAEEIFMADDTDLNQVVSLKKLGPYRSEQQRAADEQKWKKSKKKRLWEFRSKLKGKQVIREEEELEVDDDHRKKRIKKEAKIDDKRLDSYATSSKKRK